MLTMQVRVVVWQTTIPGTDKYRSYQFHYGRSAHMAGRRRKSVFVRRDARNTRCELCCRGICPVYADAKTQFLERDPNKRLGYRSGGGGMEDIKAHPWFRNMNWDQLFRKEVVPPFEPDVSGPQGFCV